MGKRAKAARKLSKKQLRQQRVDRDAQYRAALGVEPGAALPAQIGIQATAGAARGGKGAAGKGRGRNK